MKSTQIFTLVALPALVLFAAFTGAFIAVKMAGNDTVTAPTPVSFERQYPAPLVSVESLEGLI